MTNKSNLREVQDYLVFTKRLKEQFSTIYALEHSFFELDEVCNYAVRNEATCLDKEGLRVGLVGDYLGGVQADVYRKLHKVVQELDMMLTEGDGCFNKQEG